MGFIDGWIPRVARKNFAETINWVDGLIILLLGMLLACFIYLDTTPVDITVPAVVKTPYTIVVDATYTGALPKGTSFVLKYENSRRTIYAERHYAPPHNVILNTYDPLPIPNGTDVRIVIDRKTILDMLLKTKSHRTRNRIPT